MKKNNTMNTINYINDLAIILIEKLNDLEIEIKHSDENDKDYIKGQIMGYYDSLTIIKSQAEAFDIEIESLNNVDLEYFLQLK